MDPSTNKWNTLRNDHHAEIAIVQVNIDSSGNRHDHLTDLMLNRAKDVVKDAMITCAERRGGKLSSWQDDCGAFLFSIEDSESINNCCSSALEMLEVFPSAKREAQLGADLEQLITIRIACDIGMVARTSSDGVDGEFVNTLKMHERHVSAENRVTITERIFRRVEHRLKSGFVKWKRSSELGVDLYYTSETPVELGPVRADMPSGQAPPAQIRAAQAEPIERASGDHASARGRLQSVAKALAARKMLCIGAIVLVILLSSGLVRLLLWPTSPPPAPSVHTPWLELVQTEDWRHWREQIHEKLAVGKVTESTLVEALKIKAPARPEQAAAALRRDQAVADVLMTYPGVREILWRRFGIDENNFLGTGLSKPLRAANNYGAAAVHEYLIPNVQDDDRRVSWLILDPTNNQLKMTVQELLENDPKADEHKKELVKRIAERVKEKDISPAVIRFAILDLSKFSYSRKLGRPDAQRVFASNLGEVWNTRVRDAANLSGHTFTKGDALYVWAFLPSHPDEVVPATWGEVLHNLPEWLGETVKK